MTKRTDPAVRFWRKVVPAEADECWIWTDKLGPHGHAKFWDGIRCTSATIWAYEHLIAPVPASTELDHLCRNPPCVNPWHLDPVSHRTNVLRGQGHAARQAARTHCIHGHEFNTENTRVRRGRRICVPCMRNRTKEYGRLRRSAREKP